ncbi:MAG: hypothetical protein LBD55_00110 [Treponema sp.]|jgi:uncharacterized protein involved in type VI secretion and phage assembly|nr:hypothetical protein [Treponema sp.]
MPEMAVYIAEGAYRDFIPYNLELAEGFSQIFRGELTVLTNTKHTHEELLQILDQRISVTVSQTLEDGKTKRTRWVHGIVTGIKSSGFFGSGTNGCYSHTLIIEPALARLRFTQSTESFYQKTPAETIKAMLDKHALDAQFPHEYFTRVYSKKLMFEQHGTSDLDFIRGILNLYGISFTFQHKKASQGELGEDALFFTEGDMFPVSEFAYSDKRAVPAVAQFDFHASREGQNIWKMDAWAMTDAIGVDGLELSAAYPNANYGSDNWSAGITGRGKRRLTYTHIFHGYQQDTDTQEIDQDIDLTLQAWYCSRQIAKSCRAGEASNLLLAPGCAFNLSRFYGNEDTAKISALVSAAILHCRTAWPSSLGVSPREEEVGEALAVKAQCMNYGGETDKRFVSSR